MQRVVEQIVSQRAVSCLETEKGERLPYRLTGKISIKEENGVMFALKKNVQKNQKEKIPPKIVL